MAFGLPQRRRRIYLVASTDADPSSVLLQDWREAAPKKVEDLKHPIGFFWTEGRTGVGLTLDGLPPLKAGSGLGIPSMPAVLFPDGSVKTPGIEVCEALQGFKRGWTKAAAVIEPRSRWRLIGNAVSVPVAAWVASKVVAAPNTSAALDARPIAKGEPWPPAAYNLGRGRMAMLKPKEPRIAKRPTLERFRTSQWHPLSVRALDGFISRAEEGSLHFPKGFISALKRARRLQAKESP